MKLYHAQILTNQLFELMGPYCERLQECGSVRRGKSEVGDLELILIPKWGEVETGQTLLGPVVERVNLLHRWATLPECPIYWRKAGTSEILPATPAADARYWRGLYEGERLDVWIPRPGCFGVQLLVRTGSHEFNLAVVDHANKTGRQLDGGRLLVNGCPVETETEQQAFRYLGLRYIKPQLRTGAEAVQPV